MRPVTGDSSPYIIFHPLALERVRLHLPTAKLVLSLRDPVVRAWSQYNYEVKRGFEDLGHPRRASMPSPSGWRARRNGSARIDPPT